MEKKRLGKKNTLVFISLFILSNVFYISILPKSSAETKPVLSPVSDIPQENPSLMPMDNPLNTGPITPSPKVSSEKEAAEETLSLDLRGMDVTELLKVLSKKLNINIIPSRKVSGRINVYLNNITYEDALDVIMLSQGLAYEKKGDKIIMVMTEAEYETLYGEKFNEKRKMITIKLGHAQPKKVFDALNNLKSKLGKIIVDEVTGTVILIDTEERLKSMQEVLGNMDTPAVREIFELQYAKAVDIKDNIASLVTAGSGNVLVDERTNSLIVDDLSGNIDKIKQAIRMLDQSTKQVYLEAAILEITLRDRFQYGINWETTLNRALFPRSNKHYFSFTQNFPVASTLSAYERIVLGLLDSNSTDATINFLNTLGDTKILSTPKIAVVNNEEAVVMVGERRAYVTGTTSQSGESTITSDSVEFVDVGIKLRVVPTINRDGFVTIKIKPEVSSVKETLTTGSSDEPRSIIPIISTSEATTTVKVKDGTTILIAGLRKTEDKKDVQGLPYVSRIPLVGLLFQNRDDDRKQTEIIIFLTPHIMYGDDMRSWDIENMKKNYPKHMWPENRGYTGPEFKSSILKHSQKLRR